MITQVEASRITRVSLDSGVDVHLVHNAALEALLFDRNLIELPFRKTCLAASEFFLRHITDELAAAATLAELVILSKGLAYQLGEAYASVIGENLPTNLIATQRRSVLEDEVSIEVTYRRFDAGGETLLIGDTVASGATICSALAQYMQAHTLRSVFVLSYAGSVLGANRIAQFCQQNGIAFRLLYGLAAFGLAPNRFDLSFLDPATIAEPPYVERARLLFSNRAVSAVGWDFGSQSMAPQKYRYLSWVEAKRWDLEGDPALDVAVEPPDREAIERDAPRLLGPDDHPR